MLKLQPNPTFKAKVPVSIAGQVRPTEIEVEFKYMSRSELREFFARNSGENDDVVVKEIIVGWSGVEEAFSEEALDRLLDKIPTASADLFAVFRRELLESKQKN